MDAAFVYLRKFDNHTDINIEEFDRECGVGVVVSEEDIRKLID